MERYMDPVFVGGLITVMAAAFGWVTNIQSRVSVLEQQHDDLKELINSRFDSSDSRLGRIERSLNGNLAKD